ncbi:MAG: type I DNA topoisomerase [Pseudomonadota bacterium]
MEKVLVVVESPAKAKTIKKYLGSGFEVKASVGHVKDLPTHSAGQESGSKGQRSGKGGSQEAGGVLGVDVENGFSPQYVVIPGKEKIIKELREAAERAEKVFLATDPDREGEAIAWHLSQELRKPPEAVYRVLFNELTEKTIKSAVASPTRLDENKFNAQQTRRILDRIVGYQLSPLLWQKVHNGLSAGRVQSVALRLIVGRQEEIERFVPEEHWSVGVSLEGTEPPVFDAKLIEADGARVEIRDAITAEGLVRRAREHPYEVLDVVRKQRTRNPVPPFITSTLQQDASRKLRMSSSQTMRTAQQLYEGIELGERGSVGLITYMRTDSPRIAPEAITAVREYIKKQYGDKYLPAKPNYFKSKKLAQEAHEAIRPTSMELSPDSVAKFLDKAQANLYRLIWSRFTASQMAPAIMDQTTARIKSSDLVFRAGGSVLRFDGFLKAYLVAEKTDDSNGGEGESDSRLPDLQPGQKLRLLELQPRQHFTQPPPAFTEASLIKELEDKGIGRPSTYAEIVTTIQKRKYVKLEDKKFKPTLLSRIIARLLLDSFPQLLNADFTAEMESLLDLIEEGNASWIDTLDNFYRPFKTDLRQAKEHMKSIKREGLPVREACPECGEPIMLRSGRFGLFLGCSAYPGCSFTTDVPEGRPPAREPEPTEEKCPECGAMMVIRDGRTGPFLSWSRYPQCKTARPRSTGVKCPECGQGELAQRRSKKGKNFYSCTRYPDCSYSLWNKPVAEPCPKPDCAFPIMEEKTSSKQGAYLQCPKCKHKVIPETSK